MDQSLVAEAYRLYAAAIWRRCMDIMRNEAGARDVTQEVFVRCLRHHQRLRAGRELLGWLYRVATNLCLNELRDQKTGIRAVAAEGGEGSVQESDAGSRVMTAQLLSGLDRRSQEVAIYVFVDGMTHAEAAEVAQVSERTIRNCLSRFVEHGRGKLGIDFQEEA